MAKLKAEDIAAVKGRGFLINRGTDCFSGRIVAPGTVFTAEDFENIAALSAKYGSGKLLCTSRMAVEIPGISFENIPAAEAFAAAHGLRFGGPGPRSAPSLPARARPVSTAIMTPRLWPGRYMRSFTWAGAM